MIKLQTKFDRVFILIAFLLSLHFTIAYNTMTAVMVGFVTSLESNYKSISFYRMLPTLIWDLCHFSIAPLHKHFPVLNPPFASDQSWFMVLLTFFFMFGTILVGRELIRTVSPRPELQYLALGLGYAAYFDYILVLNRSLFYPYDIAALFFFTLLVYLAWQGRALALAIVLPFAILNKETSALSILIFFCFQWGRIPLGRLLTFCGGMSILVIAIRLSQKAYLEAHCPGCSEMSQNQFTYNLHQFANPLFWISIVSVYGFGYIPVILFWGRIPLRVRRTSLLIFSIWFVGMMRVGILREIRIYSELSSLILLMIVLALAKGQRESAFAL